MARLDAVIERFFQDQQANKLVFETGTTGFLHSASGPRPVFRQALSAQQIVAVISEVAPGGNLGNLESGAVQYSYVAPAGPVEITVEKTGGMVRAVVTKGGKAAVVATPSAGGQTNEAKVASRPAPLPRNQPASKGPEIPAVPSAQEAVALARDPGIAMEQLLEVMLDRKASDLHLSSQWVPMLRIDGDLVPCPEFGALAPERLKEMLWTIAPERNRVEWDEIRDTDFAHENPRARFRVNVFEDRMGIGAVLRQIPSKILTAEEMGLPQAVLDLCYLPKGLILVTGPTGSGKSTTLAGMIDYINRNRSDHIITIEDPVEFVHPNKRCLVNQREVGVHTNSFKNALRAALREDPDIVLVGELRDLETIAIAIETAETGHLVFGTLHTNTAASTVDRIIDQFPADRQEQIRIMLSESLRGVIAQTLCKKKGGGRVPALEILICTPAVSNLIREGKTFQIPSTMQTSRSMGMSLMNDSLLELVRKGLVEPEEALRRSVARSELKSLLQREKLL